MSDKLKEIENKEIKLKPKTLLETIEHYQKQIESDRQYWKSKSKPFVEYDAHHIKLMLAEIKEKAGAEIDRLRRRERELTDWLRAEIEGGELSHDFVENLRERLEVIETAEEKK